MDKIAQGSLHVTPTTEDDPDPILRALAVAQTALVSLDIERMGIYARSFPDMLAEGFQPALTVEAARSLRESELFDRFPN